MKKIWLVGLVLATILATAPVAMADTYSYIITGINTLDPDGVNGTGLVSGIFTLSGSQVGSVFTASSGTILLDAFGITTGAQIGNLIPTNGFGVTGGPINYISPSGYWEFDDTINFSSPDLFTDGLLFSVNGYEVAIWYNGPYTFALAGTPDGVNQVPTAYDGYGIGLTLTPEPSSLMLLGTGLLCMAGFLFWKAKPGMVRVR